MRKVFNVLVLLAVAVASFLSGAVLLANQKTPLERRLLFRLEEETARYELCDRALTIMSIRSQNKWTKILALKDAAWERNHDNRRVQ